MRAETDAAVLAEFTRQWRANGYSGAELDAKVAALTAQQADLAAFETSNAGSRLDGPDPMRDHPAVDQALMARWAAERGAQGAALFSRGYEVELAEAEAEMARIIERSRTA